MKTLAYAGFAAALAFSAPAVAMEHTTVIEHPAGPITADYAGATRVEMKQVGTVAGAGRASSLRCQWSVSLSVERQAQVGANLQAKRSMLRNDVITGASPGWCSERGNGIDRVIEARRDDLRSAMMAMVAQDRAVILVEAEGAHARQRAG
ncbi:hypothetical protein [Novosphingobium taihuense]|uniref:UrcA family protein n=1 Tax=Novosphingobium taihuense TaxID=260085 RepID=A0A7W7AEZ9_9SPHN|nr:hypothetical protein [Novosphingobium taihuense]MBB4615823.1 hypothetical protein [Novosphingobium taihuense]TWH82914.1 hypothetical protein IQ25_03196 [Novosphingobium taihuense]